MKYALRLNELLIKFQITEKDLAERKHISTYISSFSKLIAERFFQNYSKTEALHYSHSFENFFNSIFSDSLDEGFIEKSTRQINTQFTTIKDTISILHIFQSINEIIIDLASVNKQVNENLKVILKFLNLTQAIVIQIHEIQKRSEKASESMENRIVDIFNLIYHGLSEHKNSFKKIELFMTTYSMDAPEDSHKELHENPLKYLFEKLEQHQEVLYSFGLDYKDIYKTQLEYQEEKERLINAISNKNIERINDSFKALNKLSKSLTSAFDLPLKHISTTSFLAIHSSMRLLQQCSNVLNQKENYMSYSKLYNSAYQTFNELLLSVMAWCIDDLIISKESSNDEKYDISSRLLLNHNTIYINITVKDIPNKLYIKEILKLLIAVINTLYLNKEKEITLIELANRAEQANHSKDVFLANMSHELRTPLNAIIGFSQLLMLDSKMSEQQHKYINSISVSGKNLLNLVNTILDFAKLEAGKFNFSPKLTSIQDLIHETATIIQPMCSNKSIDFDYIKQTSLQLYLDPQLIKQVLLNLLSNAVKFTDAHGNIKLTIEYNLNQKCYIFCVEDSGIGIKAEDLQALFEPFSQLENPFQKVHKGTGLGLAIIKKIIENMHNGKIWVDSEPGVGSKFFFTIPLNHSYKVTEEFISTQKNAKDILIVEDDEEFQKLLVNKLKPHFNITLTNSVEKAQIALEKKSFTYLFIDFFLVDGIGSEVINFVSKQKINADIYILSAEDKESIHAQLDIENNPRIKNVIEKSEVTKLDNLLTQIDYSK
jgi:signal transduction histidine kinase/CheY-like chemotaxis protein/uncharacterized protein YeeX (DUF496 family)